MTKSHPPHEQPTPLAYSVAETLRLLGICRPQLYREINAGRIVARKLGRRTLIPATELQRYLDSLPAYQPRKVSE